MNLHDHDKTQVLSVIDSAIKEGQRPLPLDDVLVRDSSWQPPLYAGEIRFKRIGEQDAYVVNVNGPAKFVSEVLTDAAGRFLDSEER